MTIVGIDLKELGVSCRNVAQGLKFKADFHLDMNWGLNHPPNPSPSRTIPTIEMTRYPVYTCGKVSDVARTHRK